MNPRQRQGLMLVIIAAAGLLGVFLLIADYVSTVSKQVGAKISVVKLVSPLNPYQPVTPNMLGEVSLPQKWAPHNAITDPASLIGMVTRQPLPADTYLQQGMLGPPPGLTPGNRAMAVDVNAESGVGYQIQTGDQVDVLASYQGNSQGSGSVSHNRVVVVVPSALVLTGAQTTGGANGSVAVVLSLTPRQAQQVLLAQSYATKLTLTKVAPGSPPATPAPYSLGP
jgi:pilus assembly protein CpaB